MNNLLYKILSKNENLNFDELTNKIKGIVNPVVTAVLAIVGIIFLAFLIRNLVTLIHSSHDPETRHRTIIAIAWQSLAIVLCGVSVTLTQIFLKVTNVDPNPDLPKLTQLFLQQVTL